MKKFHVFLIVIFSVCLLLTVSAQEKKEKKKEMKETTITGEVIDVKCYLMGMMGGKGEDHKQCALDCIKGGLPVGLLEEKSEKVYMIVPKAGMKGANDEMSKYVAANVKLTGTMIEKGGERLFIYTKVEEAK